MRATAAAVAVYSSSSVRVLDDGVVVLGSSATPACNVDFFFRARAAQPVRFRFKVTNSFINSGHYQTVRVAREQCVNPWPANAESMTLGFFTRECF